MMQKHFLAVNYKSLNHHNKSFKTVVKICLLDANTFMVHLYYKKSLVNLSVCGDVRTRQQSLEFLG